MITGAHVLLYTTDPDRDRAFFRDVLEFRCVDAGHGWLIFTLPPAELALHPAGDRTPAEGGTGMPASVLYLMCDNVRATVETLEARGVTCSALTEERWGVRTTLRLPSGGEVGLYQPMHPTALRSDAR